MGIVTTKAMLPGHDGEGMRTTEAGEAAWNAYVMGFGQRFELVGPNRILILE